MPCTPQAPARPGRRCLRVQAADFDPGALLAAIQGDDCGAVASFIGHVRAATDAGPITAMTLEHYPGMTEKALGRIMDEAVRRWDLTGVTVVHRVGRLRPGARIVMVACAARHRHAALAACAFLIDRLKTDAPFWKKEDTPAGSRWVAARDSDAAAAAGWRT